MQGGWGPRSGGSGYGPPGAGGGPPPHGHAYGASQGYPVPYGSYEFNAVENGIIDKTASRAKLFGIISAVIGGLQVIASCGMVANASLAAQLPTGIIALVVGVTFVGVGNALKSVVQTQGNDLMHLMQALQKLGSAFMIQIIAWVIGAVAIAVVMVIAMFVLVAAAASQ
jgi:hypothetical protein